MSSEFSGIIFGLVSAALWGAGDFSGGVATKRTSVYTVIIGSQVIGGVLLMILALLLAEPIPTGNGIFWGIIAGWAGAIGLVALYRGLATGRLVVVAPVAAVIAAVVPIIAGVLIEGAPAPQQLIGFVLALAGVWFISGSNGDTTIRITDLILPTIAGLGFGFFFIFVDQMSNSGILFPLVAVRVSSLLLLVVFANLTKRGERPSLRRLPLIVMAGILDTGGNAFFALATLTGRLDIATILSSLYPAGTILLARFVLKEELNPRQWFGIVLALIAVALITV